MPTLTAAPFPEGCTLPPEQCATVTQLQAGAAHYEATRDEAAPTSAALAVVLVLGALFLLLSNVSGRKGRARRTERVTP